MSSTTSTKLGDDFLRIPKLEVTGKNWVIYKDRFIWAVDARGFVEHLDANAAPPVDPNLAIRMAGTAARVPVVLTAAQRVLDVEWKKELCKGQGDLGEIQRPLQSPPKAL
ncbi:hypothetical protein B0H10DRAFT_2008766 [Mycena sp. CBHHK59/15]|nr:hypothetical protein B0H10DRAFT_2008766 [Mycena sp. CBHHK59/15]